MRTSPAAASLAPLPATEIERLAASGTNAFRLLHTSEGWIESFGPDLLLSYQNEAALQLLRAWVEALPQPPRRLYGKSLPRQNAERVAPVLLAGDPSLSPTVVVQEGGVSYGLDFCAGYSAGLFLDQRQNRAFVRHRRPRRLLNTFAYTCSFSVVAALAGAETVSLDLSAKSLDRGRANFALNQLPLSGHTFIADDVLEVLPRLVRRGEKFDAVILDPPTFSRGAKGRRFQVEKDLGSLLLQALDLAQPNAAILLSTNCTRLTRRDLESMVRHCLKTARRAATFHSEPPLADIPPEAAAQTLWLLLR